MKKSNREDKAVGEILREYRTKLGFTQKKIADYLSVDRTTYAKYENGERRPQIDVLVALADFYSTNITEMLGDYSPEDRGMKRSVLANSPKKESGKLVKLTEEEVRLIEYYRNAEAKSSIIDYARKIQSENLAAKAEKKENN